MTERADRKKHDSGPASSRKGLGFPRESVDKTGSPWFLERKVFVQFSKLNQLSLKQVLQFSVISFLVLIAAMVVGVQIEKGNLLGAGPRINYTGRQRMLSERMDHFAFSFAFHRAQKEKEAAGKALKSLQATRKVFGDTLEVLIAGGVLKLKGGGSQSIERAPQGKMRDSLEEGAKLWRGLKPALNTLISETASMQQKKEALDTLEPTLGKIKTEMSRATMLAQEESEAALQLFALIVWAGLVAGILLSLFLTKFFKAKILAPLHEIRLFTEQVAGGDVSQGLELDGVSENTELGQLSSAVNGMGQSLKELLSEVQSTSNELAAATEQISATSENMFRSVDQQVQTTQQVKVTFGEMVQAINEVAMNSSEAAGSANQAGESAQQGGKVVSGTIQGMHTIRDTVVDSSQAVERLGEHSQKIGKVIEVINDIAEQTNLLALNATIEAARAGEHGRGFAVVADEVRQLAERTTDATTEIADAIQTMQSETESVVFKMQEGTQVVESGVQQAVDAEKALVGIVGSTDLVASKIETIAAAAEEQSATVNEISNHVEGISEGAEISKRGAEEVMTAAARLTKRAETLSTLVGHFKT
jgi:methyl-accepting chemotaxis protein